MRDRRSVAGSFGSFVRSSIVVGCVTLIAVLAPMAARAEFPERPITLIVPWEAGGTTDQTSRALSKAAEAGLGQPILVVNKPGASSAVAITELVNSKPDGYTICTLTSTSFRLPLIREVPFDATRFTYVSRYGENLFGIAVLAESRWKTFKDLVADGRAQPMKIKYGTAAVGTGQHMTTEAIAQATGAKFTLIPYKGAAGAMPALLGGHVDFITELSVWAPFVEAGKVRLLAISSERRDPSYPDAPTFRELGFADSVLGSLLGIIGPPGMPEPVRVKLENAFRKALADPGFMAIMNRLHMQVIDGSGADLERVVKADLEVARGMFGRLGKLK